MKKFLFGLFAAVLVLALAACGTKDEGSKDNGAPDVDDAEKGEKTSLIVGASNTPHAVILEEAKPLLAAKGYDLTIESYTDYVLPNKDLEEGTIDANYFQHIPYLDSQIADFGYDFVNAGAIHIEPIGVYSKKYDSLEELPDGATILISNSVADHGRVLAMLEEKGLIKLADDVEKVKAEVGDIVENPKNLEFDANYEAALMPQLYNNDEGDALLINSNYAIDAGLNPMEDSIALEDKESPYVNVIAVKSGNEDSDAIKALVEVLTSEQIQDFILNEWSGSVVPVK
ncbi:MULTISPECIES: MetQ/NlpA family ABC transporter substrate-binding protein [unclassified Sporosarcina]|uniref:MetQ/NlpA family ABC transporter substrate-binding protein n=1 Tax=unclassified Sporosarcina TaxID=2647733 RepID=UPI000C17119C|nr:MULTISPECIES: MetQ/NlpA family ABC transporter substrate-binding protein [unclassified Sporosarcina]PID05389.1 methionine ABC transporter substrate-binding protein [Sporosarcina sp. P30]PID08584.1 methionine ABC transporter substrate-binding protein [Sporosarcina sp. P31]PID11586.1 methionine ABC transporter substrate-binding protein [Sporosarcina sp. P32b]